MEVKSADLSLDLKQLSVPIYTDTPFSVTNKKQRQLRDEDSIKTTFPRPNTHPNVISSIPLHFFYSIKKKK